MKNWSEYSIKKVEITDRDYPSLLRKISSGPKVVYFRGELNHKLFQKSLAVVGSRQMSRAGKLAIEQIIPPLALAGVTIISGFMYGVDTEAHRQCLQSGGVTAAIFGNGLDIVYPPDNDNLYSQILNSGGLVLSEYPSQTKPKLWTYPRRNRLIAALSTLGVLVVEAGENSGSLITVKAAQKQKKKVWAVPGLITSLASAGTNRLIQSGQAKMVLGAQDILGEKKKPMIKEKLDFQPLEKKIYENLKREPLNLNQLAVLTNQNIAEISKTISLMALKGWITEVGGQYYPAKS